MAALELGTEEGVLVAVFCDGVVETDGEEDGTKDEEGEGGELGVGVAITLRRTPAAVGTTFVTVAQVTSGLGSDAGWRRPPQTAGNVTSEGEVSAVCGAVGNVISEGADVVARR